MGKQWKLKYFSKLQQCTRIKFHVCFLSHFYVLIFVIIFLFVDLNSKCHKFRVSSSFFAEEQHPHNEKHSSHRFCLFIFLFMLFLSCYTISWQIIDENFKQFVHHECYLKPVIKNQLGSSLLPYICCQNNALPVLTLPRFWSWTMAFFNDRSNLLNTVQNVFMRISLSEFCN